MTNTSNQVVAWCKMFWGFFLYSATVWPIVIKQIVYLNTARHKSRIHCERWARWHIMYRGCCMRLGDLTNNIARTEGTWSRLRWLKVKTYLCRGTGLQAVNAKWSAERSLVKIWQITCLQREERLSYHFRPKFVCVTAVKNQEWMLLYHPVPRYKSKQTSDSTKND